jgi:hypothetical protein
MKLKTITKIGAALTAVFAFTSSANAALISGTIEFFGLGNFEDIGGNTVSPILSTQIDFVPAGNAPGVTGTVSAGTGNYASIPAPFVTNVSFTDFSYGAPGTTGALSVGNLWTLSSGGLDYSFDLSSITINQAVGTQRNLEGDGMAFIKSGGLDVFDPTPGHWTLSSSGRLSFSSSTSVPDGGATVALFGLSLLGLTGVRRFIK